MGARSRRKGRAWEQAVTRLLRPIFGDKVHRGDQRRGGGAAAGEGCDNEGTPFWVESKHEYQTNIKGALRQALIKQDEADDERPPVIVCKDDKPPPGWRVGRPLAPPLASMLLSDWLALVQDWTRLKRLAGEPLIAPTSSLDTRNA